MGRPVAAARTIAVTVRAGRQVITHSVSSELCLIFVSAGACRLGLHSHDPLPETERIHDVDPRLALLDGGEAGWWCGY